MTTKFGSTPYIRNIKKIWITKRYPNPLGGKPILVRTLINAEETLTTELPSPREIKGVVLALYDTKEGGKK